MPKIVDYDKVREFIIERAITVFGQKGYYDTSFSDIASECGMARTTLYQYFANKDAVFEYVIQSVLDDIEKDCREIICQQGLSVVEKIKKIFGHFIGQGQNMKYKARILLDLKIILKIRKKDATSRLNERVVEFRDIFLPLLKEGMQNNEIKIVDLESMSSTLYSLLETSISKTSSHKEGNSQGYLNNLHILIDGLKA